MLNQSGVTTKTFGSSKSILEDDKVFFSMSCRIKNEGITADENGKKIVYAGSPLSGDLKARDTAFVVAGKDDTPVGVVLHDVDVTGGTANGTVLVFGFVNMSKIDSAALSLLQVANTDTTKVIDNLKHIVFVK